MFSVAGVSLKKVWNGTNGLGLSLLSNYLWILNSNAWTSGGMFLFLASSKSTSTLQMSFFLRLFKATHNKCHVLYPQRQSQIYSPLGPCVLWLFLLSSNTRLLTQSAQKATVSQHVLEAFLRSNNRLSFSSL